MENLQLDTTTIDDAPAQAAPQSAPDKVDAVSTESKAASGEPLTLEALEALAIQNNPTLAQARSQVEAERAKALQAGLYPNPVIGYVGEQIGVMETAGEFQGGFLRQEIVTAGKLRLSREKFQARATAAQSLALTQEYLVINTVRVQYYRTLGVAQRLEIQRELLKTAQDQLITVREMFNVGQANQADLHQARILLQEQQLSVQQAENDLQMEWETLMALVGIERPPGSLAGDLEGDLTPVHWDEALNRLLAESPELKAAHAKLESDKIAVQREKVEPIPNIVLQGGAGHNFEARETVYTAEVTIELPLFDRNQGTIRQAVADMMRQEDEVRRIELRLRQSLAEQVRRYRTAAQHVKDYQEIILPQSRQRYTTRLQSYQQNRGTWPAVLEAQRDYFLRRLIYIDNLVAWREAKIAIDGLLLVDGLTAPSGVSPVGHIDAVSKPR